MSAYDTRHGDSVRVQDAVEAAREENELEAIVDVVGDGRAQRAVHDHVLPLLVANLNRRAD